MQRYLRKARVTFPGGFTVNPLQQVTTSELRVTFDCTRGISGSPNTFSIEIYNLTSGNRNAVGRELQNVVLEVGYLPPTGGGHIGTIASGQIRDWAHRIEGNDIITTVSCGDGDAAYRRATTSKTIPAGSSVPDAVEQIASDMQKHGVTKGEWKFPDDVKTYARPYSMCGCSARELDVLGRGAGFYWSIQNGALEVFPGSSYLPGVTEIGGLIGSPEITDNGVLITAQIEPNIRPGRLVRCSSRLIEMNAKDNTYRVGQVDFSGDNTRGEWKMVVHGESLLANGDVDEGKK